MNSTERVRNTILGKPVDRQPIYGWVFFNLKDQITEAFGSVEAFEDKYEFDAAHIFSGISPFNQEVLEKLRAENEELTPDLLLDVDFHTNPDDLDAYQALTDSIKFHKERDRFCYVQTPGFFEAFNDLCDTILNILDLNLIDSPMIICDQPFRNYYIGPTLRIRTAVFFFVMNCKTNWQKRIPHANGHSHWRNPQVIGGNLRRDLFHASNVIVSIFSHTVHLLSDMTEFVSI